MGQPTQTDRLIDLTSRRSLTADECDEIATMPVARHVDFARGVILPDDAFRTPGKAKTITLEGSRIVARHFHDLAAWPSLFRLSLESCLIDQGAIGALTSARKLTDLWLADTNLTNDGLREVGKVTQLEWLTIGGTNVTDSGLASLVDLERLRALWIDRSTISDAGLLTLQHLVRLSSINRRESRVTDAGEAAFFRGQQATIRQRREATRKRPALAARPDPNVLEHAVAAFRAFSRAMAAWEIVCAAELASMDPVREAELKRSLRAIFEQHCTSLPRAFGRPNTLWCQSPSAYDVTNQTIDDVEADTARRVYIHVTLGDGSKMRYAVVTNGDRWLVDNAQFWYGGWQSHGL
jgi:hypothetical protein